MLRFVAEELTVRSYIVMWNDIDLYHDLRDFTSDPVRFPPEDMRRFIQSLVRLQDCVTVFHTDATTGSERAALCVVFWLRSYEGGV